jgi:acetyl esterase
MLLVCPNTDLTLSRPGLLSEEEVALWVPDPADRAAASPLLRRVAGMPPTLIVTAEHDPLADEGDDYAELLRKSGALVVHRKEAGLPHNLSDAAAEDRFIADARMILSGAGSRTS